MNDDRLYSMSSAQTKGRFVFRQVCSWMCGVICFMMLAFADPAFCQETESFPDGRQGGGFRPPTAAVR